MKDSSIKRLYYSISEVSRLADEEQYVLRYWETEFEQLRPQKNRAGNRIYTDKDIHVIKTIKKLLREKRYTIEGAKEMMKTYHPEIEDAPDTEPLSESEQSATMEVSSEEIVELIPAIEPEPILPANVQTTTIHAAIETLSNHASTNSSLTKDDLRELQDVLRLLHSLLS